ncbi:MAG: hypothetical protein NVS2B4_03690 [Ramlibacter sp.]
MNLSASQPPPDLFADRGLHAPAVVDKVKLHRLKTPAQIATVLHLRDAIDLSVHSVASRDFFDLEKKEMNAGSCSASNSMVS